MEILPEKIKKIIENLKSNKETRKAALKRQIKSMTVEKDIIQAGADKLFREAAERGETPGEDAQILSDKAGELEEQIKRFQTELDRLLNPE